MTDDETAEVLREAIDAYLAEVDPEDLDFDDLAWVLVNALGRAGNRQGGGLRAGGRPSVVRRSVRLVRRPGWQAGRTVLVAGEIGDGAVGDVGPALVVGLGGVGVGEGEAVGRPVPGLGEEQPGHGVPWFTR